MVPARRAKAKCHASGCHVIATAIDAVVIGAADVDLRCGARHCLLCGHAAESLEDAFWHWYIDCVGIPSSMDPTEGIQRAHPLVQHARSDKEWARRHTALLLRAIVPHDV